MSRYVAFLRGMNLGRRRIKNDELCACFEAMGFVGAAAFLASGNVIFDEVGASGGDIAQRIEDGLRRDLGYDVPTFLRRAGQVRAIAVHRPFTREQLERAQGKLQVGFLQVEPDAAARATVTAACTERDRLALHGRELYWLPSGRISDSELDLAALAAAVGPMTVRTRRTVERIATRFL